MLLTGSSAEAFRRAFDEHLVDGLVSKSSGIRALEQAVAAVRAGRRATVGWESSPPRRSRRRTSLDLLTGREREVLALLTAGAETAEMAASLGVSVNTVRTHVRSVLHKLGVHHRTKAIHAALQLADLGVLRAGVGDDRDDQYAS